LTTFKGTQEAVVVGYFADATSSAAKAFLEAAASDDSYSFAITSSEEVKSHLSLTSDSVVIVKDYDERQSVLAVSAATTDTEVLEFIHKNGLPLLIEFSESTGKLIFNGPYKVHFITFLDDRASYFTETSNLVRDLAKEYRGKVLFIYMPASKTQILEYFGISASDLPKSVLADMRGEGMKKFNLAGDISADNIKTFIDEFFAGKVKPSLKSAEPSAKDDSDPVKVIVGKTFADKVVKTNKNVLLEFYAPWCGHCKTLAPKWDEVGEIFENSDQVVIAKIDAVANEIDHPGVSVSGFPTIYFFPADDKSSPVKYEGKREVQDIVKFLKENGISQSASSSDEL